MTRQTGGCWLHFSRSWLPAFYRCFPRQSLDAAVQATALIAAFYFARRRLPASARPRVEFCGAWLCVALSLIVLAAWGASWFDWLRASGGMVPPLSLVPTTGPLGNRHDVALPGDAPRSVPVDSDIPNTPADIRDW